MTAHTPTTREIYKLKAERIFDLVEGLPSWGDRNDAVVAEARRRCMENIQGEIAGAVQFSRDALVAALRQIADHPTGWPPPEEENASMRGIARAALALVEPEKD
jgi:hypothetical protein